MKTINLKQIKRELLKFYGYRISEQGLNNYELTINPIFDGYNEIETIYFSIRGSPPKGRAIFIIDSFYKNDFKNYVKKNKKIIGDLIFLKNIEGRNFKTKRIMNIFLDISHNYLDIIGDF